MLAFNTSRDKIAKEYNTINWQQDSGLSSEELKNGVALVVEENKLQPRIIVNAEALMYVAKNAQIAADEYNIFQDKINHCDTLKELRGAGIRTMLKACPEEKELVDYWNETGIHGSPSYDFGHTSADTKALLELGINGIIERLEKYSNGNDFYKASITTFKALSVIASRLANAKGIDEDASVCLKNISSSAPKTTFEALQLIYLYFSVYEFVLGGRLRTLGGLDRLLYPFYVNDIKNGVQEEYIRELFKFFFYKIWAAKVPFDLPFMLGGIYKDGSDAVNELSYLIVDVYSSLDIYSPKIHIRVNDSTPESFVIKVIESIKKGNSSFVFINDKTVISALMNVGISKEEAYEYVLIGCYEPAVVNELPCTGAGITNLAKILELTLNNSSISGIKTFDELKKLYKENILSSVESKMNVMNRYDKYYGTSHPFPLLSATMEFCVKAGKDAYEGGAKYNNSSVTFMAMATVVDSLCVLKKFVFDDKRYSLEEFCNILKNNWEGYSEFRNEVLKYNVRYGVNSPVANQLTKELADFCADIVNNKENGRGGVYKAGLFSIDHCYEYGKLTGATADGRYKSDSFSKNLCAVTGMDTKGITSLILSASAVDHTKYPNGTVLDFVLHPSAVKGSEGSKNVYNLIKTYFSLGGLGIHGNILDNAVLKKAQETPELYPNLQIRLCGWNVFFADLSKEEQDDFIKQAGGFYE